MFITCGIKFYVLAITQNVIIFIVADIIIQTGAHFMWVSQYTFEYCTLIND